MPLTDGAVDTIKAQVTDWTQPLATIDATVNGETIPNPVPQPQLPRRLEWYARQMIIDLVPNPTNKARLKSTFDLAEAILNNDKTAAATALTDMVTAGVITSAQRTAVINWAQANIPDTTWKPNVSWAESTLGRKIDYMELDGIRREAVG